MPGATYGGGADWTVRCWDVKSAGGLHTKSRENGVNGMTNGVNGTENGTEGAALTNGSSKEQEENIQTLVVSTHRALLATDLMFIRVDLVETFPTKRTPVIDVQFTPRNLCLVAGPYLAPEQR